MPDGRTFPWYVQAMDAGISFSIRSGRGLVVILAVSLAALAGGSAWSDDDVQVAAYYFPNGARSRRRSGG